MKGMKGVVAWQIQGDWVESSDIVYECLPEAGVPFRDLSEDE